MKRIMLAAMAAVTVGCNNPIGPIAHASEVPAPIHNNIPATFVNHPEGPVIWLCATQPREYITTDGRHVTEEDHYLQYEPCPSMLVK